MDIVVIEENWNKENKNKKWETAFQISPWMTRSRFICNWRWWWIDDDDDDDDGDEDANDANENDKKDKLTTGC